MLNTLLIHKLTRIALQWTLWQGNLEYTIIKFVIQSVNHVIILVFIIFTFFLQHFWILPAKSWSYSWDFRAKLKIYLFEQQKANEWKRKTFKCCSLLLIYYLNNKQTKSQQMQTKNFQMLFIATNLLYKQQTNKKPINENEKLSNVVHSY